MQVLFRVFGQCLFQQSPDFRHALVAEAEVNGETASTEFGELFTGADVGRQHGFFHHALCRGALLLFDTLDLALLVEDQVVVRTVFHHQRVARAVFGTRFAQGIQAAQAVVLVGRHGAVLAFDKLCNLGVAEFVLGADSGELVFKTLQGAVTTYIDMHHQYRTQCAGDQREAVFTKIRRQHGQGFTGQVNTVGPGLGFLVEC